MSQIAAGAAIGSAILGFKGNMQAAKAARQAGEYNAVLAENERELLLQRKAAEESALRRQSDRLASSQRVLTAKSGIQMSGSPMLALADTYFNTEMDALNIRYAADVEAVAKTSEAALSRATGRARAYSNQVAAYQSLLGGGSDAATLLG